MTYLIVALAVLSRLAPHPPNFSPVFGAFLFSRAYLKKRDSIWFPVALLAVSDMILTSQVYHMRFRLGWTELLNWSAYAVMALIGGWLRRRVSPRTVLAASLAGPTAFFLISNFAVWLGWQMYPATWQGLFACYIAGLPFFRSSLLSSLLFCALLFGAYEFYRKKFVGIELHNSSAQLG